MILACSILSCATKGSERASRLNNQELYNILRGKWQVNFAKQQNYIRRIRNLAPQIEFASESQLGLTNPRSIFIEFPKQDDTVYLEKGKWWIDSDEAAYLRIYSVTPPSKEREEKTYQLSLISIDAYKSERKQFLDGHEKTEDPQLQETHLRIFKLTSLYCQEVSNMALSFVYTGGHGCPPTIMYIGATKEDGNN